jgi:hypothetical protein
MCGWFDFLIDQGSKPPGHGEGKRLFPLVFVEVTQKMVEGGE